MTETVPCLLRIGDNLKKYKIFKLDKELHHGTIKEVDIHRRGSTVTIGRSAEVTYSILSNMISRCHAIIKRQEDKTWTLTDNKSLNGSFVNGRQLTPSIPHTLNDGDMVQLGVPTTPNTPAEFVYKFYSSLKVRIEKKNKRLKRELSSKEEKETLSASESSEIDDGQELKRKVASHRLNSQKTESPSKAIRQQMEESQKQQAAKEAEYQERLAEMERLLKEKEEKQKEFQEQLERERQEKENQAKEVEELRLKEQAILIQMQDKQEQLEKEKEELKKKMQEELEANVKEREAVLRAQLSAQREALLNEKKQVEESLQKEMEKAIEEKNKELEKQLVEQKDKLGKILEKKDLEHKVLESQLNETKEESESAKLKALKARDDVLSNFVDLMEMELQCPICNELFIKATSLNCAHVFCKLCINQWMKVKKECPNCRTPITSQMQAIALDGYIDRMVNELNDEMKQRRKLLVEQRKAEQEKYDGVAAGPSNKPETAPVTATTSRGVRSRGRGRTRGGRVTTRGGNSSRASGAAAVPLPQAAATILTRAAAATTSAATATTTAATTSATGISAAPATSTTTTSATPTANTSVIELSDESESSDSTEDDDDDDDSDIYDSESQEGDESAYYGGYGRCYNCVELRYNWSNGKTKKIPVVSRRGHWANGCPY